MRFVEMMHLHPKAADLLFLLCADAAVRRYSVIFRTEQEPPRFSAEESQTLLPDWLRAPFRIWLRF